ncbi:MAG: hypothetical protein KGL41_03375 [Actinomycetales bacterium]|nr:hypothetical protein [Actinomycetales bacterium]
MSDEKKNFAENLGSDFGKDWGKNFGNDWGKRKVKAGGGFFYFLGFLGAAIYFVSQANDFWAGVLGVIKAIVWPAFLVFDALKALGA